MSTERTPTAGRRPSPACRSTVGRSGSWPSFAPVATALALILGRGHLSAADNALILVVVTVAVASWGNRAAAAVAALVSAGSFDFFLTRPYQSFRIGNQADLTTETPLRGGGPAGRRTGRPGAAVPDRGR